ncbi:bola protein [Mycena epipterygia]|nr:bola protein [Mycena epipterygia]
MPIDTANLEAAIRKSLNCSHLEIQDQSSGCGENYAILLVSDDFEGKSTLVRHRWVNQLLKDEIAQMHAFSQVRAIRLSFERKGQNTNFYSNRKPSHPNSTRFTSLKKLEVRRIYEISVFLTGCTTIYARRWNQVVQVWKICHDS